MSAMCVPWYVSRANTGLSKHRNPVFLHFYPMNQNLPSVSARELAFGDAPSDMYKALLCERPSAVLLFVRFCCLYVYPSQHKCIAPWVSAPVL